MDLAQVEQLCRVIASPSTAPEERMNAHHQLLFLQISAEYIDQCRYILEHSTDQVALMYAAESIIKVMRRDWANISIEKRLSLRDFLVGFFQQRASNPRHFLTRKIIQVLCELTRRAWCEDSRHHSLLDQCVQWMSSVGTADLGLRVLADLVTEFDQGRTAFYDEASRRAAQAFREQDSGLSKAFYVSVDAVAAAHRNRNVSLLCESLRCLLACLSFDFASTGPDESASGVLCVYLPKQWVHSVAAEPAISRLFSLYMEQWQGKPEGELNEEAASLTLQCLVLVAGTRKSSHDTTSRAGFVRGLLTGVEALLRTRMGFDKSEDCIHHACRLVARLRASIHPTEMSAEPIYLAWLHAVRGFTCDALNSWLTVSPRSVNYLLEFWHGMVTSATSWHLQVVRSISPAQGGQADQSGPNQDPLSLGDAIAPIVDAYLTSRANMCECAAMRAARHAHLEAALNAARDAGLAPRTGAGSGPHCDLDEVDPLASEETLIDELGLVLPMIRVRYAKSAESLANIMVRAMGEFSTLQAGGMPSMGAQARLSFCMYLVGALVGVPVVRDPSQHSKQIDDYNLELAALAFRFVMERKSICMFQLEMAGLYFIQCFQYLLLESRTRAQVARMELRARRAKGLRGLRGFGPPPSVPPSPAGSTGQINQQPGDVSNGQASQSESEKLFSTAVGKSEVFPRPLRSFEIALDVNETDEMRAEDEELDDLPPLLGVNDMRRRNRYSADLDQGTPVIVDEFDAMESDMLALDLKRATALQRTIAERVAVQGGDRALLDIAVQYIFSVLQMPMGSMQRHRPDVSHSEATSQVRLLVERALGVLRKLAQGSSVIQAGLQSSPRIVSSGLLLLESEFIQDLLKRPDPDRFTLLCEPEQGRARSFFMATLTTLFFLHCDDQIGGSMSSSHGSVLVAPGGASVVLLGAPPPGLGQVDMTNSNGSGPAGTARIFLTPTERVEDAFGDFLRPFCEKCDILLRAPDLRLLRSPLIGLLRDLRGIVSAADDPRQYELAFSWFFPNRVQLLRQAAITFADDAGVAIPLLRLLGELVMNRGSRITFPAASGGGLALMFEAASIILAYSRPHLERINQILAKDARVVEASASAAMAQNKDASLSMAALQAIVEELSQQEQQGGDSAPDMGIGVRLSPGAVGPGRTLRQSDAEIKCIAACCTALTRLVNGRFASFSAFQVFGDRTLKDARNTVLSWALTSPPEHIQGFPKAEHAVVLYVHGVADTSPLDLVQLPTPEFARLVAVLGQAVVKSNSLISTPASFSIETLATLRCKALLYGLSISGENAGEGASLDPQSKAPASLSNAVALRQSGYIPSDLGAAHRVRSRLSDETELKLAWSCFAQHDLHQPNLFSDLLSLLLDRVLTAADADLTNLYALVRPITSLACVAPNTLALFMMRFVAAQAESRQQAIRDNLDPIMQILLPGTNNKVHLADCLRRQDEYTKELCKYIRRFRDFYWKS